LNLRQSFGMTMTAALHFGLEAERLVPQSASDNFLETDERPATNKQDV
jgi:hypothetical protein